MSAPAYDGWIAYATQVVAERQQAIRGGGCGLIAVKVDSARENARPFRWACVLL